MSSPQFNSCGESFYFVLHKKPKFNPCTVSFYYANTTTTQNAESYFSHTMWCFPHFFQTKLNQCNVNHSIIYIHTGRTIQPDAIRVELFQIMWPLYEKHDNKNVKSSADIIYCLKLHGSTELHCMERYFFLLIFRGGEYSMRSLTLLFSLSASMWKVTWAAVRRGSCELRDPILTQRSLKTL